MSVLARGLGIAVLVGGGFIGGISVHSAAAQRIADQLCANATPTSAAVLDVATAGPTVHHQWVTIAKWRVPTGYNSLHEFKTEQDMPLGQAYAVKIQASHPVVDKFTLQMPIDYSDPGGAQGSFDPSYTAYSTMFVKINTPPKSATSWGVNLWLDNVPPGTTMTVRRWQN